MESKKNRAVVSTSSGQPTQSKRPRFPSIKQEGNKSKRNLVLGSCLTEEDVQRVGSEVLGHVAARLAEYYRSKTSNGLESDLMPKSCSIEEDTQRVVREKLEPFISHLAKLVREQSELLADLVSCICSTLKEEVVPAICTSLEDTIRRLVREEHASSQSVQLIRSSGKCQKKDEVRNLQLQFKTKLPDLFFTGEKLQGEHSVPIDVKLVNANTGNIVESGPESPVKLKVVVLEGGFKTEDDCNWTREEFEESVMKEREGKRPLLIGNLTVILNGGTGVLGDIEFTDNSSWTRSGKFRLGLQVSPEYRENIREAVTEAFTVQENRGKSHGKHFPPTPVDEVWRLKNIGRNGPFHKNLSDAQIYNVKEFLQLLDTDSEKLRKILGEKMTINKWKVLLDHAKTCPLNGNHHVFLNNESDHDAIFNNVPQLTGLTSDPVYCAAEKCSLKQEEHGDTIVNTFVNWNDVRELDDETGSMQKKSASSVPSQVSEGQIEDLTPVQHNLAPGTCPAPVGPQAPPANAGSAAEGHNGVTLALPVQSQVANFGNALEYSVDHTFHPTGHQPISTDGSEVLFSPGGKRNANVKLPILAHDIIPQCALPSQMIGSSSQMVDGNVPFSEPPHATIPSFQSSSAFPPLEGDRVMAGIQPTVSDDDDWWADICTTDDAPPDADTFFQTPPDDAV